MRTMPAKYAFEPVIVGTWGNEGKNDENDVICYRAADFDYEHLNVNESAGVVRNIVPSEFVVKALHPGDILIEKSGGGEKTLVGRSVLFDSDKAAVCSNFVSVLRPKSRQSSRYWNYQLAALYSNRGTEPFIKQSTGIQNLDVKAYLSQHVPIRSFEEQERIADELDRELAEIDELIADQIKLKELLKEQFEAQKEQIILEAGGQQVRLSRVLKGLKDGTHGTHPRVDSGGEVLLSAKNISSGELVISEDESRISLEEAAQITASGFPRKGDVMMILVGATYGRTALYNLEQTLPFQRSVGFFRPNEELITSDYLKLVMSSSGFQQQLTLGIKTSAQPGIYLGDVASCTISLPNRSSQVSVVNKYHSAGKIYNEITADINESIENLIESRNSLLLTSLYS